MKFSNILLFLILISSSVNGQNDSIKPTELDSLYVRALNSRIDIILASGWTYVELNEYGKRIKDLDVSDRCKFLSNEELINLAIKKKKAINITRVVHRLISKDTVDINFGTVSLTAKKGIFFQRGIKFKKADFSIGCGGTNGYQPDVRFVFNKEEQSWEILKNRYVTTPE